MDPALFTAWDVAVTVGTVESTRNDTVDDDGLSPAAFTALRVTVYEVLLVRPEMVTGLVPSVGESAVKVEPLKLYL